MGSAALSLFVLLTCGAAVAVSRQRRAWRRPLSAALVACAAAIVVAPLAQPARPDFAARGDIPARVAHDGYVSSDACRACHEREYRTWYASYHRTMTQVVSPATALAPFDGSVHEAAGVAYRFRREGDALVVDETDERTGASRTRPIVLSTGSRRYQVYWAAGPQHSEPEEVLLYWSVEAARWVPKQATVIAPPGAPTERGVWNIHCIRCHSVGGLPGYQPALGTYWSTVAEFGVGCEACHGPGASHARRQHNPLARYAARWGLSSVGDIVNPERLAAQRSSEVCARCHAAFAMDLGRYARRGFAYRPGDDLAREVSFHQDGGDSPVARDYAGGFWSDGTARVGGDEYNAERESACAKRGGLRCVSCHSIHRGDHAALVDPDLGGGRLCTQCHRGIARDVAAHTHHAPGSEGSVCVNCHMPRTTWALSVAMRSHRIDSPTASGAGPGDKPNACNLCHLDRTLAWTSRALSAWYGSASPPLDADQRTVPAAVLWLLSGTAVQRAVAAWHMAWPPARAASGERWQAGVLAEALVDPYDQVRFVAGRSLAVLPGFSGWKWDFLAPPAARAAARRRVLERATPIGVDAATVARLVAARDDTPVTVPE